MPPTREKVNCPLLNGVRVSSVVIATNTMVLMMIPWRIRGVSHLWWKLDSLCSRFSSSNCLYLREPGITTLCLVISGDMVDCRAVMRDGAVDVKGEVFEIEASCSVVGLPPSGAPT